jgi:phycoerythrin-associated linker protein
LLMAWIAGMDIETFVAQSLGCWRSQRSSHNLAFQHSEEVHSKIDIAPMDLTDGSVAELCKAHGFEPCHAISPFHMSWQGESDWDDNEVSEGSCLLVPIAEPGGDKRRGKLLRSQGYAEVMPAVGDYRFTAEGEFVLITPYDHASAEERIWFGTPNLRFRVSMIRTSDGQGVVTASFASEIRAPGSVPAIV